MEGTIKGDVCINIPTSLAWLIFKPDCLTGTDLNTRPGLGFECRRYPDTPPETVTHGVISRVDVELLYNALGRFLAKHPPAKDMEN